MRVIDGEALYEKACDLEAQALAYVGKIANDETKIEEWRIWSAILTERTAFKHDIFDAPEVKPQHKKGKWIYNADEDTYMCSVCQARIDSMDKFRSYFCYHCGSDMRSEE